MRETSAVSKSTDPSRESTRNPSRCFKCGAMMNGNDDTWVAHDGRFIPAKVQLCDRCQEFRHVVSDQDWAHNMTIEEFRKFYWSGHPPNSPESWDERNGIDRRRIEKCKRSLRGSRIVMQRADGGFVFVAANGRERGIRGWPTCPRCGGLMCSDQHMDVCFSDGVVAALSCTCGYCGLGLEVVEDKRRYMSDSSAETDKEG